MSHDDLTTRPVRWGILGAGGIASSLAADIARTDGHVVAAVAARDAEPRRRVRAAVRRAAQLRQLRRAVADDDVDVVYVATTHPFHREQALAAIAAGKPVLVEKPLTAQRRRRPRGVRRRRAGGGLRDGGHVDAHQPAGPAGAGPGRRRGARGGARGPGRLRLRPRLRPRPPAVGPRQRRRRPARPRHLPRDVRVAFLGAPDRVQVSGDLAPTGVDRTVAMQWSREDGAIAQLFSSSAVTTSCRATVSGTRGWLSLEPTFFSPTTMLVSIDGEVRRVETEPAGYVPQIEEVGRCLRAGLLESPLVPQAETVAILELMDGVRAELGVPTRASERRGCGTAQDRGALRGRGWQRGQEKDERFMKCSRRIGRAAAGARAALRPVRVQRPVEVAARAVDVDVERVEARPALRRAPPHHLGGVVEQPARGRAASARGRPLAVQPAPARGPRRRRCCRCPRRGTGRAGPA